MTNSLLEKEQEKQTVKSGLGNTRSILKIVQHSHLDTLSLKITVDLQDFNTLLSLLGHKSTSVEMDKPKSFDNGHTYYQHRFRTEKGIDGHYRIDEDAGTVDVFCFFRGEAFEQMSNVDSWRMCRGLLMTYKARSTRTDIAYDTTDPNEIPVEKMKQAIRDGNVLRFSEYYFHESGKCGEESNDTLTAGSRFSDKYLRIYEHLEGLYRAECEYKKEKADVIFRIFACLERNYDLFDKKKRRCPVDIDKTIKNWNEYGVTKEQQEGVLKVIYNLPDCWDNWEWALSEILGSMVVSGFDFVDKSQIKNKTQANIRDCPEFDWWTKFKEGIGTQYRVRITKEKTTLTRSLDYVIRNGAKTLATFKAIVGSVNFGKFMKNLLKSGEEKLELRDYKRIEYLKERQYLFQSYLL